MYKVIERQKPAKNLIAFKATAKRFSNAAQNMKLSKAWNIFIAVWNHAERFTFSK